MERPTQLVFSQREIASVLDSREEAAVLLGADYRIVVCNRAYRVEFGLDDCPAGAHCYEVSHRYDHPCDQVGETCPLRESQSTGEPCRTLHVHHTRHGPVRHEVTTYPVVGEDGEVTSFLELITPGAVGELERAHERLVGHSPVFNRMLEMVRRVAPTTTAVLLLGESGTGKELLAQAIHKLSPRAARPFVPVECSGISETLFESELFGHEKGAFTGATQSKLGLVEAAEGGTLFLDEVGDIPVTQQVKLLRLIETGAYRRVGSIAERRSSFRLVSATNQDLAQLVREGRFRRDLYFRINAFPIPLPPLRERREDLPILADHLLTRLGYGGRLRIHAETLEILRGCPFPGNVRELRNTLERAALLADGDTILPRHLPSECLESCRPGADGGVELAPCGAETSVFPGGELVPLSELEGRYLRGILRRFDGTHRELARRLGVSERTLYRKLAVLRRD